MDKKSPVILYIASWQLVMTCYFLNFVDIHTVAAIKTAENYVDLAEGFKDTFSAINSYVHNPIITISSVQYTLEFFLCADYKVAVASYVYCLPK